MNASDRRARALVILVIAAIAAFVAAAVPARNEGPTPAPTLAASATASPSAAQGRIVTIYRADSDDVAPEVSGVTTVCDFHIRGTVFDFRSANAYRVEPLAPAPDRIPYYGQTQSDDRGSWRSPVISLPEGQWRLTVMGVLTHPDQSRLITVQCAGGRTPRPTAVATPTPTLLPPAAILTSGAVTNLSATLRGEIAWVIATNERGPITHSLYAVPLDGSPSREVARYFDTFDSRRPSGANVLRHAFSPDGRFVVLSVTIGSSPGENDLVILDIERGAIFEPFTRTPHLDELYPAWSPDGKTISFVRKPVGQAFGDELWVKNFDFTGERRIRDATCCSGTRIFGWTPDSKAVAYDGIGFEDSSYVVRDVDTATDLWTAGNAFYGADWRTGRPGFVGAFDDSPRSATTSELRIADAVGATQRVIARADVDPQFQRPGPYRRPRWSPDGRSVLAIQDAVFPRIAVVPLDGSPPLGLGTGIPRLAEWSSDGQRVVYVTPVPAGTGPYNVMVQRLDRSFAGEVDNGSFGIGTRITDLRVFAYPR